MKNIFKTLIFTGLLVSFCFFNSSQVQAEPASITGYAWGGGGSTEQAATIGWISFKGTNYGVNIKDDKIFEGYAWSEHIGWITFNESQLSGCPSSPCRAWVEDDGRVFGWARAYRPISPAGETLGGWTGWIKFNHGQTDQVYIDQNGFFYGYAWGGGGSTEQSAIIGWISFKGTNYGVEVDPDIFDPGPDAPSLSEMFEQWNDCSFKGVSIPTFNWNYSHPGGKDQAGYEIEINGEETLVHNSNIPSTSYTPSLDWIENNLFFGERSYSWRVRVKDIDDNWSGWSDFKSFQTRKHAYPFVDFEWNPIKPTVDDEVQFTDKSEVFGGSTITSWQWQFPGTYQCISPETGCQNHQNPLIKFLSAIRSPDNRVELTVIDSSGFSCPREEEINIRLPLPEWKEVPPVIFFQNLFADITGLLTKLKI
jgi:hypothetical protein